jgi:hypothetical protein
MGFGGLLPGLGFLAQLGQIPMSIWTALSTQEAQQEAKSNTLRGYNYGLTGQYTSQQELNPGDLQGGLMGLRGRTMDAVNRMNTNQSSLTNQQFADLYGLADQNVTADTNDLYAYGASNQGQWSQMGQNLLNSYDQGWDPISQGYQQRYGRGMGYLEGMGNQQKKDLNSQYDNLQTQVAQQMQQRGLANTTVMPSMQAGVERERSDARGRLQEQLNRERLGWDAQLSGDVLANQQAGFANRFNLESSLAEKGFGMDKATREAILNRAANYRADKSNLASQKWSALLANNRQAGLDEMAYDTSSMNNILNWVAQRQDVGPDTNAALQAISSSANIFPAVQMQQRYMNALEAQADPWNQFMGGITGGVTGGVAAGMTMPMANMAAYPGMQLNNMMGIPNFFGSAF